MLTDKQVLDILQRKLTQCEYANKHGCSRSLVSDVQCGRCYTSVQESKSVYIQSGNVLAIGDLHAPFCLPRYLDFCIEQYNRFDCDTVIFMGDLLDHHYSSYHDTDPDGMSGGCELERAVEQLKPWVEAFESAYVTIGNHDRMIMRKAFSGAIPKAWIRDYKEVLKAPDWEFVDEVVIDDVVYVHGEGGSARTKAMKEQCSHVQGHLHTQAYVEQIVGRRTRIFGMQVGTGVDRRSYALAYAKSGPKPAIGCGVILDSGTLPIQIMMNLGDAYK